MTSASPSTDDWRCPMCGSANVQEGAWVRVNSYRTIDGVPYAEVVSAGNDGPSGTAFWCDDCEDHPSGLLAPGEDYDDDAY